MRATKIPWPCGEEPPGSEITITAASGQGGVITPSSRQSVGYGRSRMFVIRPREGYAIGDVEVDGVSIGPVSLYMFTDVTEDHTIRATFRKKDRRPAGQNREEKPCFRD